MKQIAITDNNYFQIFIGKRVLKEEVFNSKASIPAYSANVFVPFGFVNSSNIDNFEHDHVLWGIDGNFEFSIKRKGQIFATTDHCGAIKILNGNIIPEYLVYQLEIIKHELGFDRSLRASLGNMEMVTFSIPFKSDGMTPDADQQRELTHKYMLIKDMKQGIAAEIAELEEAIIELDEKSKKVEVKVSDICDFPKTNSRVTKALCQTNKGSIPVYGCSKEDDIVLGYIQDNMRGLKYYEDSLTWNRNGSVGHFFFRKGRFTTNEDHRVLQIKQQFKSKIYPLYLRYILQTEVKRLGYGFTHKLGKARLAEVAIKLPVDSLGQYDYETQKQIAERYAKVYQMKAAVIQQLQDLAEIVVRI